MAVKKAATKTPAKKVGAKVAKKTAGKKPFNKGEVFECAVCGLAVVIDTACDCVDTCEIVCCEQPMKPKKAARAKAAARAR